MMNSKKLSPIYRLCVAQLVLERTIILGFRLNEKEQTVPFFTAFISLMLPPGIQMLQGEHFGENLNYGPRCISR